MSDVTVPEETALAILPDQPEWELESHETSALVHKDRQFPTLTADPYVGVAAMPFDAKAQAVLSKYQEVPEEWIDIKPDGKPYLSHIHARNILNEAFGYGGWALVPVGDFNIERVPFKDRNGNDAERVNVYRVYRLYVNGRFQDEALGAGTYYTNNADADYSDACEAAKSYALNRLCKTFNIAQKCWNKAFIEDFKRRLCSYDGKKWKRNPVGAANSRRAPEPPPIESPRPDPVAQPETITDTTAIIRPKKVSKAWARGAFVTDDEGKSWTFPTSLLHMANAAINGNAPLAIAFNVTHKNDKTFYNVLTAAEVING